MKRTTILTLSAVATAAVIGAIAIPAIAHGWGPHDGSMRGDRAAFMQDGRDPGMMMGRGGYHSMHSGPMGMGRMADNPVYQSFDADEDGTVTAAELETGIAALHGAHDADGNGTLSADEFAALFAEVTRGWADRPFTMLDANDDGEISAEEMAFPAQMMARMQRMHGADTEQQ